MDILKYAELRRLKVSCHEGDLCVSLSDTPDRTQRALPLTFVPLAFQNASSEEDSTAPEMKAVSFGIITPCDTPDVCD